MRAACSPLTDGWVRKMGCRRTKNAVLAQKKEVLQHKTTRVNLEDSMLSEISQSQKDKYYVIPFIRAT